MLNVLITGANGQLGQSFKSLEDNAQAKNMCLIYADRAALDITNVKAIEQYLQQYNIDIVVNTAAYTAVDKAEDEPEIAHLINAQGAGNLAKVCALKACWLIHISTDYVFNGESNKPYTELDSVAPLGVYGLTKLAGEQQISQCNPEAVILRTSWVFSEFNRNFLKTMLSLAKQHNALRIVADQEGNPTYAPHIAQAVLKIISHSTQAAPRFSGIYHFCGSKTTSWADFARYIFERQEALMDNFTAPKVIRITTAEYPTKARRPQYSQLSNEKLEVIIGAADNDWKEGVNAALDRLNLV
jgi:dTDP-4-dehydrorhamnose reductase